MLNIAEGLPGPDLIFITCTILLMVLRLKRCSQLGHLPNRDSTYLVTPHHFLCEYSTLYLSLANWIPFIQSPTCQGHSEFHFYHPVEDLQFLPASSHA